MVTFPASPGLRLLAVPLDDTPASVSNLRGPGARVARCQRDRHSTDKSVDLQTHRQAVNVYIQLNEKNNCLSKHLIAFEKPVSIFLFDKVSSDFFS